MSKVTVLNLPCKYVRTLDGDTVQVAVDLRAIWDDLDEDSYAPHVRIKGVDTPETDSKDPVLKAKAEAAKQFTTQELSSATHIMLILYGKDKYGRRLGDFMYTSDLALVPKYLSIELLKLDGVKPLKLADQLAREV